MSYFYDLLKGLKIPLYFTSMAPVIYLFLYSNHTHLPYFLLILFTVIMIQLALNLSMDFYDYNNNLGLENGDTLFPVGPYLIYRMGKKPETLKRLFIISFFLGMISGLFLIYITGKYILILMGVVAVFLSLIYVIPPFKLDSRGLGEISTFFSFGPFIVLGYSIVLNLKISFLIVSISVLFGLLASAIRFLHHIPEDNPHGIRVRHFKLIYSVMLLSGFIIQVYDTYLFLLLLPALLLSIYHILKLDKNSVNISGKTNQIVGIQVLSTLLLIISIFLVP